MHAPARQPLPAPPSPNHSILDIDRLLRALTDALPAGDDPRLNLAIDSPFDALRTARRKAGDIERRIERGEDLAPADWSQIFSLSQSILNDHAKDLEVAVYLIESLVRLHGFAGLWEGLRLATALIERFWDAGLHPLPDEEGWGVRITALSQLFGGDRPGTLITPVLRIPLTAGSRSFNRIDFEQASALETMESDKRESRLREGHVTLQAFQQAVMQTPPAFYRSLHANLRQCEIELDALMLALDKRCIGVLRDHAAPSSARMHESLTHCRLTAEHAMKLRGMRHEPAEEDPQTTDGESPFSLNPNGALHIGSRAQARRMLLAVSAYFRACEPHTPAIYLIEKAARWLETPLPKLLEEMIEENSSRDSVFRLIGIERSSNGS